MGSDGSMKDTHTILNEIIVAAKECGPVSYTHLDVYKRQGYDCQS